MAIKTSWAAGDVLAAADLTDTLAAKLAGVKADTAPAAPATNDVWLDTSGAAGVWKIWNGSAWTAFSGGAPAVIPSVTGSPTITSYTDAGVTYDVYSFASNGTLVVGTAGLAEVLLVGAGSDRTGTGINGNGGRVLTGLHLLPAGTLTVTVGARTSTLGGASTLDTLTSGQIGYPAAATVVSGAVGTGNTGAGLTSSITGTPTEYAPAGNPTKAGGGGIAGGTTAGAAGITIIRVAR